LAAIKDTSINRYANSDAEDNKILRRRLISLKQKETVNIRDHSSQYENLLGLLIQPMEEEEQVKTYIDSLFHFPMRLILFQQDCGTLDDSIQGANKLATESHLSRPSDSAEPMSWTPAEVNSLRYQRNK
jgi:hypothetical protein